MKQKQICSRTLDLEDGNEIDLLKELEEVGKRLHSTSDTEDPATTEAKKPRTENTKNSEDVNEGRSEEIRDILNSTADKLNIGTDNNMEYTVDKLGSEMQYDRSSNNLKETVLENRELFIYVKGCQVDITKSSPSTVLSEIGEIIEREPKIVKVNKSLRISCYNEVEKSQLKNSRYLAGHLVEYSEPYGKSTIKMKNRGIIFDVDEDISNFEMTRALGVPAERVVKKYRGEKKPTKQMILHFDDELPPYV